MCLDNYEAAFYITLRPQQAARSVRVFAPGAKVSSVLFLSKHHAPRVHYSACLLLHAHTCENYLPTYAIPVQSGSRKACYTFYGEAQDSTDYAQKLLWDSFCRESVPMAAHTSLGEMTDQLPLAPALRTQLRFFSLLRSQGC